MAKSTENETISLLLALRDRLSEVLHREDNPVATVMEWAQLSTAVAKVSGELRAHEKQQAHRLETVRPELVVEFFRTLGERERLHLLRELTAVAEARSVLE